MPKPKTLTFVIPPPLFDGACNAGCPLYRVVCLTPDCGPNDVRLCGAGLGGVVGGVLFPAVGCPQHKESKRCRA
jgi:hypothetical protein